MDGSNRPGRRASEFTYRQRSSQNLGWVFVVVAGAMVVGIALSWRRDPNLAFLVWLLLGIAIAWTLFLRPHVRVARDGVTLANIVRDVFIPWPLVEDTRTRWNLEVLTADRSYTAWAISAQVKRPKSGLSGGLEGLRGARATRGLASRPFEVASEPASSGVPVVTPSSVADVIDDTKAEYAAALATGALAAPPEPAVRRTWHAGATAALVVPLVAAILVIIR